MAEVATLGGSRIIPVTPRGDGLTAQYVGMYRGEVTRRPSVAIYADEEVSPVARADPNVLDGEMKMLHQLVLLVALLAPPPALAQGICHRRWCRSLGSREPA
jgi:hypothetical protein